MVKQGLPERVFLTKHALRNPRLPLGHEFCARQLLSTSAEPAISSFG